jgi:hypothetical protein
VQTARAHFGSTRLKETSIGGAKLQPTISGASRLGSGRRSPKCQDRRRLAPAITLAATVRLSIGALVERVVIRP